ncbi:MAG: PH domain-containing protein [Oscillospiraceae bacterium]|nr:PH domain-containing protein [Oscillospiraceae bacterium]
MAKLPNNTVWSDRKRTIFGLPWSFTRYILTDEKLLIIKGVFKQTEDEIRLYRILDVSLKRSLFERFDRVGTIHCCSSDKTSGEFDIRRVKKSREVKELISDMVEKQRIARGVTLREEMTPNLMDSDHDGVMDVVEKGPARKR